LTVKQAIFVQEFPSGLVLLAESMEWLESVAFTVRVPAGCNFDPADRSGLAGLSCEQALRGAGSRDSRQFITDLDNLGIERGEGVASSHMSFSGATLAANLTPALSIYADLILRPHLPDDQFEASQSTVMQELQAVEDEPSQKVMQELRRRYYPDPWGRPSQGDEAGILSSTNGDVRNFWKEHVRPDGAVIAVAGRFDWPALCDQIGKLFGEWPSRGEEKFTERDMREKVTHLPHESNQTQIAVAYESLPYKHPDYFRAWGAVGVLSGGMSARLFTEVREKRGLCYSVYASHHTLRDRGDVFCYAGTSAERAQETLDVTLAELIRLKDGVEPEEIDRLKARIKSSLIMQQESSGARASSIARDWQLLGRVRTLDEISRAIDGLNAADISAYLAEHPPRDFTIVTLGQQPLEVRDGVS
jgi:predicted Zn-dependent peptidase